MPRPPRPRRSERVDTNVDPVVTCPGDLWHHARSRIVVAATVAATAELLGLTTEPGGSSCDR